MGWGAVFRDPVSGEKKYPESKAKKAPDSGSGSATLCYIPADYMLRKCCESLTF
jgi:hypothetical protein